MYRRIKYSSVVLLHCKNIKASGANTRKARRVLPVPTTFDGLLSPRLILLKLYHCLHLSISSKFQFFSLAIFATKCTRSIYNGYIFHSPFSLSPSDHFYIFFWASFYFPFLAVLYGINSMNCHHD